MSWDTAVWAVVAIVAIVAAWDGAYRYFRMRQTSALDGRVKQLEEELGKVSVKAAEADQLARSVHNRLGANAGQTRWGRNL